MYDEARERRGGADPELPIAKRRIERILQQQVVASIRTLESKISESGRGEKPPPHSISNALYALSRLDNEDPGGEPVVARRRDQSWPCEMYYLTAADPEAVSNALERKVALEKKWHRYASRTGTDTIGQLGERIVRDAFEAAADRFFVGPAWGNVTRVNGRDIPADGGRVGSVDGLVILSSVPPAQGSAIVEVKNQREWIYPRDAALWDIIRNGFAVDAVPIIFARKIYPSAYTYVLQRVGGLGIQTHAQFVPASMKHELADCKDRMGLGFKDLNFDEIVPRNMHGAINVLANQLLEARRRMEIARDLVTPHLSVLASDEHRSERRRHYAELQAALDAQFGRVGGSR